VSDRIAGLVFLVLAIWYGLTARSFEGGFGDPLGPARYPEILAVPIGLLSLVLLFKPDPEPVWPRGLPLARQTVTILVLFAYAILLEPLGFPLATIIGTAVLGRILGAAWLPSLASGVITGIGLYLIFDPLLGLPLPLYPRFL
jgi:putative tricarboxylic transport membrane protein